MGYLLPVNINQYKTYQMRILQKKATHQTVTPVLKVARSNLERNLCPQVTILNYQKFNQNNTHFLQSKGFYIDKYI